MLLSQKLEVVKIKYETCDIFLCEGKHIDRFANPHKCTFRVKSIMIIIMKIYRKPNIVFSNFNNKIPHYKRFKQHSH